jgi:type IV secretory pathway TraG/TraD family ATPase VirD4
MKCQNQEQPQPDSCYRGDRGGKADGISRHFVAALAVVAVSFGATEWLAATLSNLIELGEPFFVYRGVGVFPPFGALKLSIRFAGSKHISKQVREDLWIGFGVTVVGGFLAACLAYWFVSLVRDRDSIENLENFHGSAEWADKKTIKDTGLLTATDGVYVGAWREPVTRHLHLYKSINEGTVLEGNA